MKAKIGKDGLIDITAENEAEFYIIDLYMKQERSIREIFVLHERLEKEPNELQKIVREMKCR